MEQAHLKVIPDHLGRSAESYAVYMLIAAAVVCRRHDAGSHPSPTRSRS